MRITESQLRRIVRKALLEKGGRHQFHGFADSETLKQYPDVPGPKFSKEKGQIPDEDIDAAEEYITIHEPDELIAYSRGGAMVQELPDDDYARIKKIKYVAPAAKRNWTSKSVKLAPSGSEMWADSADSLVSLKQTCAIAKEAGIQNVNVWHDKNIADKIGQDRPGTDDGTGNPKKVKWFGIGIPAHQTAVDKGMNNQAADYVLDSGECVNSDLPDWKKGRASNQQVEDQFSYINNRMKESVLRSIIRKLLLEKKAVKCPRKNGKRDYKCEYQKYGGASKKGKKDRAARNQARKVAKREGRVKKGDGKEIDHKKPLSKGGSHAKSNQRVVSRSTNRKKGNK